MTNDTRPDGEPDPQMHCTNCLNGVCRVHVKPAAAAPSAGLVERLLADAAQIFFEMHPETRQHAVRDLLREAAHALEAQAQTVARLERETTEAQQEIEHLNIAGGCLGLQLTACQRERETLRAALQTIRDADCDYGGNCQWGVADAALADAQRRGPA